MTTYSATIQLGNGALTVSRPHPAVSAVDSLLDTLLYAVQDDTSPVTSVGITIITDEEAPAEAPPLADGPAPVAADSAPAVSDTPIGDALTGPA